MWLGLGRNEKLDPKGIGLNPYERVMQGRESLKVDLWVSRMQNKENGKNPQKKKSQVRKVSKNSITKKDLHCWEPRSQINGKEKY